MTSALSMELRHQSYEAINALVEEHQFVQFAVHKSARRGPFVCGSIWPEQRGYHVRCIGASVSHTIHPVKLEHVGLQADVLLHDFKWTGMYREEDLHRRFAEHRIRGEWFHPADEILAFIEGLR